MRAYLVSWWHVAIRMITYGVLYLVGTSWIARVQDPNTKGPARNPLRRIRKRRNLNVPADENWALVRSSLSVEPTSSPVLLATRLDDTMVVSDIVAVLFKT
jgi:hypothetical protein